MIDIKEDHIIHLTKPAPQTASDVCDDFSQGIKELNLSHCLSDRYGDFPKDEKESYLRRFEKEVAETLGKEDAVFMCSGVMAQNIALLIHNGGVGSGADHNGGFFICHQTSHLLLHEKEAYSELLGLKPLVIDTQNPISFEDVKTIFESPDKEENSENLKKQKVKTLILEHPHRELGGVLTPHEELCSIKNFCSDRDIKFHLDGARIFEAATAYDGKYTPQDICKNFDTVYVSFYKGLGGITGAMLLGPKSFTEQARIWLRRFGGNVFSQVPYAISCYRGFTNYVTAANCNEFLTLQERTTKLRNIVKELKKIPKIEDVVTFLPDLPQISMCHVLIKAEINKIDQAKEEVLNKTGVSMYNSLREHKNYPENMYLEWNISEENGRIEDKVYFQSWSLFIEILLEKIKT